MEFDRLGVFTYSPEEDTPAATMPDQIDGRSQRRPSGRDYGASAGDCLMIRQKTCIGQEVLVMIEGKVADESAYVGRTYGDAPKVDGLYFCTDQENSDDRRFCKGNV